MRAVRGARWVFLAALCPVAQTPHTALTWAEDDTSQDAVPKPISPSPLSRLSLPGTP